MPDYTDFSNLYGAYTKSPEAYNEIVSPVVTPSNPSGVGTGGTLPQNGVNPLMQILAALLAPQPQAQTGNNFAQMIDALNQRDPVGYANKMSTTPELRRGTRFDPWANGTFQSAGDRYDAMLNGTGAYAPSVHFGDVTPTYLDVNTPVSPDADVVAAAIAKRFGGPTPAQRQRQAAVNAPANMPIDKWAQMFLR